MSEIGGCTLSTPGWLQQVAGGEQNWGGHLCQTIHQQCLLWKRGGGAFEWLFYLYCLKGFSVSSISNSPGAMSYCNLYIFLFISRNHLTQRVSTLFPGPLVSSIRPGIKQNWTSLSKSNNKRLWKTYLVWSWTIFWRLPMYSMNQHTTPDVD